MTKKKIDKTPLKRQAWVSRTMEILGIGEAEAIELLRTPRKQSLRLNPLQGDIQQTLTELRDSGFEGVRYEWMLEGYTVDSPFIDVRDSKVVVEGRAFIQNAASWLPIVMLDPQVGDEILDVCAAPGGKTSHIAAITRNQAAIVANDNSRVRLAKLRANMERMGASADYTLYDATNLAKKLDGRQFDKITLDAPCSGEGLMHYDKDADFATWSVAHVKRLQQLQKRILLQAWQLLRPGGTLVYSTCTMAPEEDEAVVDYLLRTQEDAKLIPIELQLPNRVDTVKEWNSKAFAPEVAGCMRLKPSETIEAFFVCKLQKVGISE
ncbi:MAG TPA: RsmB/NOP family class I SAM-dependent RNA methyltransferase [Candidatus Saccharimonadales bacterium]|nr:RsmB/NOP family class I SAM-dependent RNA methyltransferase [Candidatus Saccharimonadales bacterium]